MPVGENEARVPDKFIAPRDLAAQGVPFEQITAFRHFISLLSEAQQPSTDSPSTCNLEFFYTPRIPATSAEPKPILPILDSAYMFAAGIASGEVGGDLIEATEQNHTREMATRGLVNLLRILEQSARGSVNWSRPRIVPDKHNFPVNLIHSNWYSELKELVYKPQLNSLELKWHEVNPRVVSYQPYRESSLYAEATFEFNKLDFSTGQIANEFRVYEIPWVQTIYGNALGKGKPVLRDYTAPFTPRISIAEGGLIACREVERQLADTLNVSMLHSI